MNDMPTIFYVDYLIYKICRKFKLEKVYKAEVARMIEIVDKIDIDLSEMDSEFRLKMFFCQAYGSILSNFEAKNGVFTCDKMFLLDLLRDVIWKTLEFDESDELNMFFWKMIGFYVSIFANEGDFNSFCDERIKKLLLGVTTFQKMKMSYLGRLANMKNIRCEFMDFIFSEMDRMVDKLSIPFLADMVDKKKKDIILQVSKEKDSLISGNKYKKTILDFDSD